MFVGEFSGSQLTRLRSHARACRTDALSGPVDDLAATRVVPLQVV